MSAEDVELVVYLVLIVWGLAWVVGLVLYALDALAGWIFRRKSRRGSPRW